MNRSLYYPFFLILFFFVHPVWGQEQTAFVQYVQPLSGTAASTTPAAKKHSEASSEQYANTIPAVGLPFAMTQWSPQTRATEQKCVAPYYYTDSLISGFRASHWLNGSCTQDYGSFTVMPVSGSLPKALNAPISSFSHDREESSPAYYQVILDSYQLNVAMTGTARAGIMQITALKTDSVYILIRANSDEGQGQLQVDETGVAAVNPVHRIYQGWGEYAGFDGNFYLTTQAKAGSVGSFNGNKPLSAKIIQGDGNVGIYLGYYLEKGETLRLKMGTSFTGIAGAEKNMRVEIPTWDLANVKQQVEKEWESVLGQIEIKDASTVQKRIFYTSLYHAMQHPRLFNDVDGTYPVFSSTKQASFGERNYYDDFSMWDIYRAQLPLLELLQPTLVNDMVASLVDKGKQGGWLPIFPCWNSYTAAMIGDHTTSVIASAYLKGINNWDAREAYRLMHQNAFVVADSVDYHEGKGRRGLTSYLANGYIPMEDSVPVAFHKKEQVSRTLEYAYDDYALAMMAQSLGKSADYEILIKRAKNYEKVFDKAVGMVRGRYENGTWYTPFNPEKRELYITEGTPHQYTFYVPQDIPGLATLMGGQDALEKNLDSLFSGAGYWHGNEPGHQIPFLYNYTRSPWKTQEQVRKLLQEEYTDGPGGLSGNDDAGQMSAWYVFASLGFYPVDPISGNYLLTTPAFQSYEIALSNTTKWKVNCDYSPQEYPYIRAISLNGIALGRNYIRYAELIKGGELTFHLAKEPYKQWGADKSQQIKGL